MAVSDDQARERLSDPAFWLYLLTLRGEIEKLTQSRIAGFFYQQFDDLLRWALSGSRSQAFWEAQAQAFESVLIWTWYQSLVQIGGRVAARAGYTVGPQGRGTGRGTRHWSPWNTNTAERSARQVRATADQVTRHTQDRIQAILDRFQDEPEPRGPVTEHIRALSRGQGNARAWRIARTENTAAQAYAQQTFIEQFTQDTGSRAMKGWISSRDNRVRDSHVRLDGQWRLLDEAFKENLYYPGDPRAPVKERVNCRCVLEYRFF